MKRIGVFLLAAGFIVATVGAVAASDLFVYPAKGQSKEQQEKDEFECYKWAKDQSGVDPSAPSETTNRRTGRMVGGAAKGALGGAAIGAIAGDAGKGAAIGAVGGGMVGRHRGKQEEQYEAASERNSYDSAYAACMDSRGYTVK